MNCSTNESISKLLCLVVRNKYRQEMAKANCGTKHRLTDKSKLTQLGQYTFANNFNIFFLFMSRKEEKAVVSGIGGYHGSKKQKESEGVGKSA